MKKLLILLISLILLIIISVTIQAATVHRVKPGENLYTIAREYGITALEIINKNNLRHPDNIFVKEVLIIPDIEKSYFYRVQKGDTLYKVAEKLSIPMNILSDYNNLKNMDQLYWRQILYIPSRYNYPQKYTVKNGDSLYKIARKFNLEVKEIIIFNNLNKEKNLEVGKVLKIPIIKEKSRQPKYRGPQYIKLFPDTFYLNGSTGKYRIALTFDDGPDNVYTPQILDVLKKYNVPATFFLMGKRIKQYPEVVKKIAEEGHLIANHTWSHANLTQVSEEQFSAEIKNTSDVIEKLISLNTSFIRPPEGAVSKNVVKKLKDMKYKVIFWSVDSRDWLDRDINKILINTLPNVKKDSVLLFHSAGGKNQNLASTVNVLPELIQTLRMRGFEFVNLEQLLGVSAYK